jgi:ribose 5-phosphate isomerase B
VRVGLGADHAGFAMKQALVEVVRDLGHEVIDFGTHSAASVDYPDVAHAVARAVQSGTLDRAILVCGTGVGMAIAANRLRGVRAAHASEGFTARLARLHNDAQILTLGSRVIGPGVAAEITSVFLSTGFEGGRHTRRVARIDDGPPAEESP